MTTSLKHSDCGQRNSETHQQHTHTHKQRKSSNTVLANIGCASGYWDSNAATETKLNKAGLVNDQYNGRMTRN